MLEISILDRSLKIAELRLRPDLVGANELTSVLSDIIKFFAFFDYHL